MVSAAGVGTSDRVEGCYMTTTEDDVDLEAFKDSYDWQEAFACAMRDDIRAAPGYSGSVEPFSIDDVTEIIAISDGQNDEQDWVGAFRLEDGRFAFVSAWCDYTGWGCRDGGLARVAETLDDLIRLGMGDADRARLFPDSAAA